CALHVGCSFHFEPQFVDELFPEPAAASSVLPDNASPLPTHGLEMRCCERIESGLGQKSYGRCAAFDNRASCRATRDDIARAMARGNGAGRTLRVAHGRDIDSDCGRAD